MGICELGVLSLYSRALFLVSFELPNVLMHYLGVNCCPLYRPAKHYEINPFLIQQLVAAWAIQRTTCLPFPLHYLPSSLFIQREEIYLPFDFSLTSNAPLRGGPAGSLYVKVSESPTEAVCAQRCSWLVGVGQR